MRIIAGINVAGPDDTFGDDRLSVTNNATRHPEKARTVTILVTLRKKETWMIDKSTTCNERLHIWSEF